MIDGGFFAADAGASDGANFSDDGAGFGDDGAEFGMAAGMGAGAGLLMAGGSMGAMAKMVPPTPAGPVSPAAVRAQLEKFKQLQAEGLITQEDYDAVKARVLGLGDGAR